jgi:predicted TIM-barrel fold metal-dependent hydrolase
MLHSPIDPSCHHCQPRRRFLSGLLTATAATVLPSCATTSKDAPLPGVAKRALVDVHHHVWAPEFLKELESRKLAEPPARNWSLNKTLDDMAKAGVTYTLTSPTTPAAGFGDVATMRRMARISNEYGAQLARDYPRQFGFFATLPMLDVDSALSEIAYSCDVLKANGIAMLTSYNGKWLGDPAFAPIMNEINRRKLTVYTHPSNTQCCQNLQEGVPGSTIEFATDTTRTITSLLFSGTATRCKDIQFIFSHAGGTMPFLVERLTMLPKLNANFGKILPSEQVIPTLRRFYYDTAQASHPGAMLSLLNLVDVSQVVFGTDFPYRTSLDHVKGLMAMGFSMNDLTAIESRNAQRLLSLSL